MAIVDGWGAWQGDLNGALPPVDFERVKSDLVQLQAVGHPLADELMGLWRRVEQLGRDSVGFGERVAAVRDDVSRLADGATSLSCTCR